MLRTLRYYKYYSKILLHNWFKSKNSYSQHGEDILIESLFPNRIKSFIDIGANDGVLSLIHISLLNRAHMESALNHLQKHSVNLH